MFAPHPSSCQLSVSSTVPLPLPLTLFSYTSSDLFLFFFTFFFFLFGFDPSSVCSFDCLFTLSNRLWSLYTIARFTLPLHAPASRSTHAAPQRTSHPRPASQPLASLRRVSPTPTPSRSQLDAGGAVQVGMAWASAVSPSPVHRSPNGPSSTGARRRTGPAGRLNRNGKGGGRAEATSVHRHVQENRTREGWCAPAAGVGENDTEEEREVWRAGSSETVCEASVGPCHCHAVPCTLLPSPATTTHPLLLHLHP
ncbi:hypothetical protein C8Q76DRAFT_746950 [Earliella scabrosa]|nr:hypothetical protein C8Q76DRAFT_746950 [Earliella scabrosa]